METMFQEKPIPLPVIRPVLPLNILLLQDPLGCNLLLDWRIFVSNDLDSVCRPSPHVTSEAALAIVDVFGHLVIDFSNLNMTPQVVSKVPKHK